MIGWIVLALALSVFIVSLVFLYRALFRKSIEKKKLSSKVAKTLDYIADENDFLLLHDVQVSLLSDSAPTCFAHILFGDRYIYIIETFVGFGAVYGNVKDPYLFLKKEDGSSVKIKNPLPPLLEKTAKLEKACSCSPEDKRFVSAIVYNNSLDVPKGIARKEQGTWFLPYKELEKTIKIAETDEVSLISHEQTDRIAKQLKAISDQTKERRKKRRKRKGHYHEEETD